MNMFELDKIEILDAINFINENKIDDKFDSYNKLIDILSTTGIRDLNDKEKEKSNNFYEEHKDCCRKILHKDIYSSTGGGFSYLVTWTPVGFKFTYKCNSCDMSEDITDYGILVDYYNANYSKSDDSFTNMINNEIISFLITGTGLGLCTLIIDRNSNNSKDITNSDSW